MPLFGSLLVPYRVMRPRGRFRTSKYVSECTAMVAYRIRRRRRRTMQVEADQESPANDGDRFTVGEINIAIGRLSDGDIARLVVASKAFSRLCDLPAEDLIQEAYARALDGSRTCGRETAIVGFLCGVMKSLASQENKARKNGFRPVVVLRKGEPVLPEIVADIVSPEQAAVSAIDDVETLAKIELLVVDDEQLQLLLEGIYDNMRGAELQDLLGIDEKGLATLRKKLRRGLQGSFPGRIVS
jgi:DNA-directed RNA polymerase specialized sigma24 family protein